MKLKTDEPCIPKNIRNDIVQLQKLLDEAQELYDNIFDWYDKELKTYDSSVDADMELYHPGTGIIIEGISASAILDGLSILQTANETAAKTVNPSGAPET